MRKMNADMICMFGQYLFEQERSRATIEKYTRALERFCIWLNGKNVEKGTVILYKQELMKGHAPTGVNCILAALNGFFRFAEWQDCVVKPLRVQKRIFASPEKELSREEYMRLLQTAEERKDERLALLLQLMASTGIRVSEIRYVTVEALDQGFVCIDLKGKIRTILLPGKLCRKLKKYRIKQGIMQGPVFLGRSGKSMDRRTIWAQMKRLCKTACVSAGKVFPHNLRHLFARAFYHVQKDIAKLADMLGHSSMETTRIYLLTSGTEHRQVLERLRFVN